MTPDSAPPPAPPPRENALASTDKPRLSQSHGLESARIESSRDRLIQCIPRENQLELTYVPGDAQQASFFGHDGKVQQHVCPINCLVIGTTCTFARASSRAHPTRDGITTTNGGRPWRSMSLTIRNQYQILESRCTCQDRRLVLSGPSLLPLLASYWAAARRLTMARSLPR